MVISKICFDVHPKTWGKDEPIFGEWLISRWWLHIFTLKRRGPERRTTNPWAAPMLVKNKVGIFFTLELGGSWGI